MTRFIVKTSGLGLISSSSSSELSSSELEESFFLPSLGFKGSGFFSDSEEEEEELSSLEPSSPLLDVLAIARRYSNLSFHLQVDKMSPLEEVGKEPPRFPC